MARILVVGGGYGRAAMLALAAAGIQTSLAEPRIEIKPGGTSDFSVYPILSPDPGLNQTQAWYRRQRNGKPARY